MRLGLSHFNEHKFKHSFNDTINPICICGRDVESINHFFLHHPENCEARQTLFENIQSIDKMLLSQNESSLTHLLLYGHLKSNSNVNALILNSAIEFVYLPEDSMDRYLKEFKMFFFSNSLFIWLFVFVYLVCFVISHYTYIPGVCSFVVIFYFLSF